MKINVYCNDYFVRYNRAQMEKHEVSQLRSGYIRGIYNKDDLFILRGEPTFHYDFDAMLDFFTDENYILTTHGNKVDAIINYDRVIPYISFNWDGLMNDAIKGYRPLTSEIIRALNFLKNRKTTVRIAYTISPFNARWLMSDAVLLKKMMDEYPNMKQPYFMLYQQGAYYSQQDFVWTTITKEDISGLNKLGLLTESNLKYLLQWLTQKQYQCVSPQNEIVVAYDASVRVCQSYKIGEVLGSLNEHTLPDIIASSEEKRKSMLNCEYKEKCWFACNLKDNLNEREGL